jgi:hypothetical protein
MKLAPQTPETGYVPVESKHPLRGLNVAVPSTQVDPSFSPKISNVFMRDGEALKRSGYVELASPTQSLTGTVMAIIDFQALDTTRTLLAVTTTRQYRWDTVTTQWIDATAVRQGHAIFSASPPNNWFKVYGDHSAVFIVDSEFTVDGSTGNDGDYKVTAVSYTGGTTDLTTITVASVTNDTDDGRITGPFFTILSADTGSNFFTVDGDQTSHFPPNQVFVVEGAPAGNNGEYTVTSSSFGAGVTTINVLSVPDGTTEGTIQKLFALTTASGDYIDWDVGTDRLTHRLYITNGRDEIRYWDGLAGSSNRFVIWQPRYPNFVTAKTVRVFFDMLVLGNVTTTSNDPKVVAWSSIGDFDDYNDDDNTAGTLLIPGLSGGIQRMEPLGDRLVVYSEDTIALLTFLGVPIVLSSEVVLQDTRLASPRAVVPFGSAHLYVSQEDIYYFDGTSGIRSVGVPVRSDYKRDVNFEFGTDLHTFNDPARRMIFITIPTSDTTSKTFTLDYDVFDLTTFRWSSVEFTDQPETFGFFLRRSEPTWETDTDIQWDEDTGNWFEAGEQVNFPVRMMGSGSQIYIMDETSALDGTATVTASYETRDFVVPNADLSVLGRWLEIEADLAGTEVQVYYSTDLGVSFTEVGYETAADTEQTLTSAFQTYRFFLDTVARNLRVKFESTLFFRLRWVRAWVRPHAPR